MIKNAHRQEQIELPAKLLNNFLQQDKGIINQTKITGTQSNRQTHVAYI